MLQHRMAFLALILSTPVSAIADPFSYLCQVKHVYTLSENGSLITSNWENSFKGGMFMVSRDTGKIVGRTLTTKLAKSTHVVNQGSEEWSFTAFADFGHTIQPIHVQEFREGANKPFVSSSMGGAGIVTGICTQ